MHYPNKVVANRLIQGFSQGFKIHYHGPRLPTQCNNLKSADDHPNELKEKIYKEIQMGRIQGPFKQIPISNLRLSPIGLVPKGDNSGWRLITHLSFPKSNSVNYYIDPNETVVQYSSFDSVIQMIANLGKGAFIGKRDIKSAFRLLPIFPGDFDLLGFKFQGNYFIDKCLPMGCSISCKVFEEFSTFLQWATKHRSKATTIDHYLDDFIFAGRDAHSCQELMSVFQGVCDEIGVPIAEDKSEGPTTVMTFLGFEIDTVRMLVRIPNSKSLELQDILHSFAIQRKATLQQILSVIGKLNFFTRAIRPGRAFLRRLHNATIGVTELHYHIRITQSMRQDMYMWISFLESFNGAVYFLDQEWTSDKNINFYTDSAGSFNLGCGAYFNGEWCFFPWPETWAPSDVLKDMTFLELVPVVLAISLWGGKLANKKIVLHIDNQAVVAILNKLTSKSERVMTLLRSFVLASMKYNILFRAVYIASKDNIVADSISRKQWARFRQAAPHARPHPCPVPPSFLNIISSLSLLSF